MSEHRTAVMLFQRPVLHSIYFLIHTHTWSQKKGTSQAPHYLSVGEHKRTSPKAVRKQGMERKKTPTLLPCRHILLVLVKRMFQGKSIPSHGDCTLIYSFSKTATISRVRSAYLRAIASWQTGKSIRSRMAWGALERRHRCLPRNQVETVGNPRWGARWANVDSYLV